MSQHHFTVMEPKVTLHSIKVILLPLIRSAQIVRQEESVVELSVVSNWIFSPYKVQYIMAIQITQLLKKRPATLMLQCRVKNV